MGRECNTNPLSRWGWYIMGKQIAYFLKCPRCESRLYMMRQKDGSFRCPQCSYTGRLEWKTDESADEKVPESEKRRDVLPLDLAIYISDPGQTWNVSDSISMYSLIEKLDKEDEIWYASAPEKTLLPIISRNCHGNGTGILTVISGIRDEDEVLGQEKLSHLAIQRVLEKNLHLAKVERIVNVTSDEIVSLNLDFRKP